MISGRVPADATAIAFGPSPGKQIKREGMKPPAREEDPRGEDCGCVCTRIYEEKTADFHQRRCQK